MHYEVMTALLVLQHLQRESVPSLDIGLVDEQRYERSGWLFAQYSRHELSGFVTMILVPELVDEKR